MRSRLAKTDLEITDLKKEVRLHDLIEQRRTSDEVHTR